jgi:hypothetical protein
MLLKNTYTVDHISPSGRGACYVMDNFSAEYTECCNNEFVSEQEMKGITFLETNQVSKLKEYV